MSGDECRAGQELVFGSLKELIKRDPNHELIGPFLYGGKRGTDEQFDESWEKFQVRFGKPGLTKEQRADSLGQAHFWANWHLAIKEALKGME